MDDAIFSPQCVMQVALTIRGAMSSLSAITTRRLGRPRAAKTLAPFRILDSWNSTN